MSFRLPRASVALSSLSLALAASGVRAQATPTIDDSAFEKTVGVAGVEVKIPDTDYGRDNLVSAIDKRTRTLVGHSLVVFIAYSDDWRFYEHANDENAEPLPFHAMRHDIMGCDGGKCTLSEGFGIDVPEATLKAHEATGYALKVYSQHGPDLVIRITPEQIRSQLRAVSQEIAVLALPPLVTTPSRQPQD